MTRLREWTMIERPVEDTEARLRAFLHAKRATDGKIRMQLCVPMGRSAGAFGLTLDREVRVQVLDGREEQKLNEVLHVSWQPEGRVILPCFEGTLVVWGEDDPARSFIELDGRYHPPLGAAGLVFDEAIGHQIAQATAREFLRELKAGVETSQGSMP
jgi:hypothetical protein